MKKLSGAIYVAFTSAILCTVGCGVAPSDETVGQASAALAPAEIRTWDDLVNLGTSGDYVLKANINAQGKTWLPKSFSGTFDGGNFTISNLAISNGSFFYSLDNATVKNLKLIGVKITGSANRATFGGLASTATDSRIENCAVEMNINMTAVAAGGIVGAMYGGSIYRSYAKGTITGVIENSGGLVGYSSSGAAQMELTESYAQVTVNPDTSNASSYVRAGGLVGYAYSPDIHDVYAVGNVTGRGAVGGMVGELECDEFNGFMLYKTIYRGDVVDKNRSSGDGWAGSLGAYPTCQGHDWRFTQNFYDNTLDQSRGHYDLYAIRGFSTQQLQSPTSVIGGVFCEPDVVPGRCGDNTWASPPWTAGSNSQHHVLTNMPGPNAQPR